MQTAASTPRTDPSFAAALICLLALLALLGVLLVPAHWTSIWMDWEFTGWVVPVGNRFADGMALYTQGGHSPMPPLSFVLTYFLSGGDGTWVLESSLNFLFQSGILLLFFLDLSRRFDTATAFWTVLAATTVFFMLPKSILYDSMAQFLVAATTVTVLTSMDRYRFAAGGNPLLSARGFRALALPGSLIALTLLTKQSTGVGLALGCSLALFFAYTAIPARERIIVIVQLGINSFAILMLVSMLLALGGFISMPGMLVDVIVNGSEPKGGSQLLLANLGAYFSQTAEQIFPWAIVGGILVGLYRWRPHLPAANSDSQAWVLTGGIIFSGLMVISACYLIYRGVPAALQLGGLISAAIWELRGSHSSPVLWTGFFVLLGCLVPVRSKHQALADVLALRRYALILIPAGIFHSLSVTEFRWAYDNNPLVIAVICALFVSLRNLARFAVATRPALDQGVTALIGLLLSLAMLSGLTSQLRIASDCTENWQEVQHLQSARLRPHADGMRKLVAEVRRLTPEDASGQVLLLPEDPNVQAWFERPRPELSSAIIFTDQYWDKFVDRDYAQLADQPPAVIIIGPRKYLQSFHQVWRAGEPWGASRLLQKVEDELLPDQYELAGSVEINFRIGKDFMDVYRRRTPSPGVMPGQ